MELFCHPFSDQVTEKHLTKTFAPILREFSVYTYRCRKLSKGCATLTLSDSIKGRRILDRYGPAQTRGTHHRLSLFGKAISVKLSRNTPDEFLIRNLEEEERKRIQRQTEVRMADEPTTKLQKSFAITCLSCGYWDYKGNDPVFTSYFRDVRSGTISFGRSSMKVVLAESKIYPFATHQVEFDYFSIRPPVYLSSAGQATITVQSWIAPRIFVTSLETQLKGLSSKKKTARSRTTKLEVDADANGAMATCFTYRCTLTDPRDLQRIHALRTFREIPQTISWVTTDKNSLLPYNQQTAEFARSLNSQQLPYRMKFQLQKIVWDGSLPPDKVIQLFPSVCSVYEGSGISKGVQIVQQMAKKIEWPNPEVRKSNFDIKNLNRLLNDAAESIGLLGYSRLDQKEFHSNQVSIHHATVTPLGVYLNGPFWESKNRVLRKYPNHTDYFMRVEFHEEIGEPMRFDYYSSLDEIFQERFKSVLKNGISIGGRLFEFLGFSNSSLRAQSCWFMAQFATPHDGLLDATNIIRTLGDFSQIYSPAKCAARIGQAFTETYTSVRIHQDDVKRIPDVVHGKRVFSDGVGTISASIMNRIYKEYALRAGVKPTVFQIRFAGAKGMVSFDSTLNGAALRLRNSMVKFEAANALDIEICGAGINPLPFYLNRQLIKILEDLKVPAQAFLQLQKAEIDRLQVTTRSPILVANFLEHSNVAKSAKLPSIIRLLHSLKISFSNDDFLRQTVEMALLLRIRELKYRSRIPVEAARTLYGIMDETGFLKENQIYCVIESDAHKREVLVRPDVIITRSPALHPGDVQIVDAVDVPPSSPLNQLHNCIVFSQHGDRDLPSKLSGGDLDGDLYNIIYDDKLLPGLIASPADYDRVPEPPHTQAVERVDIIDFFLKFMQQDQLGRIATLHQTFADQKPAGTFDPDCELLAELHSTAVDFQKTGIPVDLARIPRPKPFRPDFMAPGPRVKVEANMAVLVEEEKNDNNSNDDEDEDGKGLYRYYESTKVLGELYRAVDEYAFLKQMQSSMRKSGSRDPSVLTSLWAYLERETDGFQWRHRIEDARDIRDMYKENLEDLMYKYATSQWDTVSEIEVFIGNFVGKDQSPSRYKRDQSMRMQEDFSRLVDWVTSQIAGKTAGYDEGLEMSIACLYAAVEDEKDQKDQLHQQQSRRGKTDGSQLRSFNWIAAAACWHEVARLQRSR